MRWFVLRNQFATAIDFSSTACMTYNHAVIPIKRRNRVAPLRAALLRISSSHTPNSVVPSSVSGDEAKNKRVQRTSAGIETSVHSDYYPFGQPVLKRTQYDMM